MISLAVEQGVQERRRERSLATVRIQVSQNFTWMNGNEWREGCDIQCARHSYRREVMATVESGEGAEVWL